MSFKLKYFDEIRKLKKKMENIVIIVVNSSPLKKL